MGVQFCNFKIAHKEGTSDVDVKTVSKSEFKELVGDYALMCVSECVCVCVCVSALR